MPADAVDVPKMEPAQQRKTTECQLKLASCHARAALDGQVPSINIETKVMRKELRAMRLRLIKFVAVGRNALWLRALAEQGLACAGRRCGCSEERSSHEVRISLSHHDDEPDDHEYCNTTDDDSDLNDDCYHLRHYHYADHRHSLSSLLLMLLLSLSLCRCVVLDCCGHAVGPCIELSKNFHMSSYAWMLTLPVNRANHERTKHMITCICTYKCTQVEVVEQRVGSPLSFPNVGCLFLLFQLKVR